ncbi:S1 RNA-binding domain-containing protein [Streptomyces sp. NPDC090088]|uniref:S1 RNA-binding domain-containing protein n=1 Tax=Streptomyces sp. NPDC090088 TaxID=3365944 RepID=UPI00382C338E
MQLVDVEGEEAEIARIPRQEASMRRMEHPSELFEIGQEINAEEIGRWREGQLHLSARAREIPALRSFLLAFEQGKVVAGTVSEVHNFGVFVHVDGEPDGLCYVWNNDADTATLRNDRDRLVDEFSSGHHRGDDRGEHRNGDGIRH